MEHKDKFKSYFGGDQKFNDNWTNLQNEIRKNEIGRLIINIDGASGCGKSTTIQKLQYRLQNESIILNSIDKNTQKTIANYKDKMIQSEIVWEHRESNWENINSAVIPLMNDIIFDRSLLSTMTYQNNSIEYIKYKLNNSEVDMRPDLFVLLYSTDFEKVKKRLIIRDGVNLTGLDKIENPDNITDIASYEKKMIDINEKYIRNFNSISELEYFKNTKFLKLDSSVLSIDEIVNCITLETNKLSAIKINKSKSNG